MEKRVTIKGWFLPLVLIAPQVVISLVVVGLLTIIQFKFIEKRVHY